MIRPLPLAACLLCFVSLARAQYSDQDYYNAALGLLVQGQCDQAIQYLEEAIKINPSNTDAWGKMAQCQEKTGKYPAALASYQKILTLKPGDPTARRKIGELENLAKASTQKGEGLAGGKKEERVWKPGFSFSAGPALSILKNETLNDHLDTTYRLMKSGFFVLGDVTLEGSRGLSLVPTYSLFTLNSTSDGRLDRGDLGSRFRVEGALRHHLAEGFYLKPYATAQYQLVEKSGYHADVDGTLEDDQGIWNVSGKMRIEETWRANAQIVGLGLALGLMDEDEDPPLNQGSLGLEVMGARGATTFEYHLRAGQDRVDQEASLSALGLGIGGRLEVVKKVMGVPIALEGSYRLLKTGGLKGTFSTRSELGGSLVQDQTWDPVYGVSLPVTFKRGVDNDLAGRVARFNDSELPDEHEALRLDLSGWDIGVSARVGF